MATTALWGILALIALVGVGAVGWLLGATRARTRGLEALRAAEGAVRAERATAEALKAQAAMAAVRTRDLEACLAEATRGRVVAETLNEELRARLDEQGTLVERTETRLVSTFRALAAEALRANNEGFLTLADQRLAAARRESVQDLEVRRSALQHSLEAMVAPVRDSLARVDDNLKELARERAVVFGRVSEQLRGVMAAQERLQAETGNLARALRAPSVRGRWGEIHLKRVVELAGMVEHCDFGQQVTLEALDGDGARLRPDLVVRLPGDRQVVVDAKVPLEAYLRAVDATSDDDRRARLAEHAAQVRAHLHALGSKSYWAGLPGAPEFVVMFLPADALFAAALEAVPGLLEEGVGRRVLVATPTTLIALLQTVHHGWRQERIARNAEQISDLGRILHERVATLVEHWGRLGGALGRATEAFNAAVTSWEGRVLPAARRLEELGAGGRKPLGEVAPIDRVPRVIAFSDAPDGLAARR